MTYDTGGESLEGLPLFSVCHHRSSPGHPGEDLLAEPGLRQWTNAHPGIRSYYKLVSHPFPI